MELERERHDKTWRTVEKPMQYQPILPPAANNKKETKKDRHQRDQDFYDAGRYKEGARDDHAKRAWLKVTRGKVIG
jgi:hypothetical protein